MKYSGSPRRDWFYNECQNSGVDYQRSEVVKKYEGRHSGFRNFAEEARRMMDRINSVRRAKGLGPVSPERQLACLVDLGCGTGALALELAHWFMTINEVDVSEGMLGVLEEKLASLPPERAECRFNLFHDGFLTYRHEGVPADVVLSSISLHHIPDFWKVCALDRISRILAPNGLFYLTDVIFTFPATDWEAGTQDVLDTMSAAAGKEANLHLEREYSTYSWIMEAMFEKTGLRIESVHDETPFLRTYVCSKQD